jgi:hypothetical protein
VQFDKICRQAGLSRRSTAAAKAAHRDIKRALAEFDGKVERASADTRLSVKAKRFLLELWYGDPSGGALSMANRKVREASLMAAIIVLLLHAQEEPLARKGRTRFRMLTTTPELGIVDVDGPKSAIVAVGRHFDQAVRGAGVGALGFLDIAFVDNSRTLAPPKLALHMHAAIRAPDNMFRVKAAETAASPSQNRRNSFGLVIVKITARKRDWGKRLTRENVAGLGYYVAKITCGICRIEDHGQRSRSRTLLQGWTWKQALRQLEWYSYADLLVTTRGVGAGVALRKQWKALLLRLLKLSSGARGQAINSNRLDREWNRIWADLSSEPST